MKAFTLVEVLVVIAIIALLAAIGVQAYMRSRLRAQATSVLNELRVIEEALIQYSSENHVPTGSPVNFDALKPYLKTGSSLEKSGLDVIGNPHGPFFVDSVPQINSATFERFEEVTDEEFWRPYYTAAPTP